MNETTVKKAPPSTLRCRRFELQGKEYLIEDLDGPLSMKEDDISFTGQFWYDKYGTGMSYPLYILRKR